MNVKLQNTKFLQAAFIQITGCVALFGELISGGEYIALSSLSLTIYSMADVTEKRRSANNAES